MDFIMAADTPPAPDPNLSKKATVRITLPPKPGAPSGDAKKETIRITLPQASSGVKKETVRIGDAKKETIRINLPTQPGASRETIRIDLPANQAGSEESRSTMQINIPASTPAPAASALPKPPTPPTMAGNLSVPPTGQIPLPPKPTGANLPPPPSRPGAPLPPPSASGIPMPPKPPGAPVIPSSAPAAAAKPAIPAPAIPAKTAETGARKPVAPKKETTRISLPPDPKSIPKATVKLNQTAPLSTPMPTPSLKTADITTVTPETSEQDDPMMLPLSILALLAAAFALWTTL